MNHFEEQERRRQEMESLRRQEKQRDLDEQASRRQEFEARTRSQELQKQKLLDQYRQANQANQKQLEQEKRRAALRKKENQIKLAQKRDAEKKKKDGLGTEAMQRAMEKRAAPEEGRSTFIKAKRVLPTGLRISATTPGAGRAKAVGGSGCLVMFAVGIAFAAADWALLHR